MHYSVWTPCWPIYLPAVLFVLVSLLLIALIVIDSSHLITFEMVCYFVVKVFLWYSLVCERYEALWLGWLSFSSQLFFSHWVVSLGIFLMMPL